MRRSPSRKWSRHKGPSVGERVTALLRTAGPDGPVPWTVAELADGSGAHPTSVAVALYRLEGEGAVERAGAAPRPGGPPIRLWRATLPPTETP